MPRRKQGRDIDGVVLLDKPWGCSANSALQRVRRAFNARKAGHTGSLDPRATGLLPVCLGEATKLSAYLLCADKQYRVTAAHGFATETGDREGRPTRYTDVALPAADVIRATLADFVGAGQQIPPMYSALKHKGQRLYVLARSGRSVERTPRVIAIRALRLIARTPDSFTLVATVSGGTYIRTLVEDIAARWGGAAHVAALRRTGVGELGTAREMTRLATIEARAAAGDDLADLVWPASVMIDRWPKAWLDDAGVADVCHGRAAKALAMHGHGDLLRLTGENGELFGLGRVDSAGQIVPKKVFARPQR